MILRQPFRSISSLSATTATGRDIHIYSSALQEEVEVRVAGLHSDGVGAGWPYGEPRNAPKPKEGFPVDTVYWD